MTVSRNMPDALRTDRLDLHRPTEADMDSYVAMRAAQKGWESGHAWRSFAATVGHWMLRGYGFYTLRTNGKFVGITGLWYPLGWEEVEIGWHVTPSEQNKGYATEAARRIRLVAAETLGIRRLVSYIRATNAPSQAVACKLGARREGATKLLIGDGKPHPSEIWRHPDPLEAK